MDPVKNNVSKNLRDTKDLFVRKVFPEKLRSPILCEVKRLAL